MLWVQQVWQHEQQAKGIGDTQDNYEMTSDDIPTRVLDMLEPYILMPGCA